MTQWIFTRGVDKQMDAFVKGFVEIVPIDWLQYFDERELEVSSNPNPNLDWLQYFDEYELELSSNSNNNPSLDC